MPLDNTDLYHIAWVVENLELSMNAFGSTGLQWAKPTIRTVRIKTPTTEITEFSIFVTYSIHDPLHVELIKNVSALHGIMYPMAARTISDGGHTISKIN